MRVVAVIPARYASTRFPGKPLALLKGKPMLQHVYERVSASALFDRVIVATDDERIRKACESFGAECVLTSDKHPSGSDRIAEVVREMDCEIVFNVQGDEPLISKEPLAALLSAFDDDRVEVASLMTPFTTAQDIANPNMVKVVTALSGNALYFSRSVIPHDRDGNTPITYMRHIGVYAYRKSALLHYVSLPQSPLEQCEKLEQLRLLENGISIRMIVSDYQGIGIDTRDDLVRVEDTLSL